MTDSTEAIRIVELRAENVQRLEAVAIRPKGPTVVIGGKNGNGKSCILRSLWMGFGGKGEIPKDPVRTGAVDARIEIDLDNGYKIRRIIERDRTTRLEVVNADGFQTTRPQAFLDSLTGGVSFDPLSFANMKPLEQVDTLKRLVGLDFTIFDERRKTLYEERTGVNNAIKSVRGHITGLTHHPDAPAEEVSLNELTAQMQAINEAQQAYTALGHEARRAEDEFAAKATELARLGTEATAIEQQIADLQAKLEANRGQQGQAAAACELLEAAAERKKATFEAATEPDASEIEERLAKADATNRKVRENARIAELQVEEKGWVEKGEKLTDEIKIIDQDKRDTVAVTPFPIPGLSLNDEDVLYQTHPLSSSSDAEKVRVAVAIALSLCKRLKVVAIKDGAYLDEDSFALVEQLAEEHDALILIERVGSGPECHIIIEAGRIKEDRTEIEPVPDMSQGQLSL